jgi:hypothetical protein
VGAFSFCFFFAIERALLREEVYFWGCAIIGVLLQDTAGQERFGPMSAMYYRGAQGVILGTSLSPFPRAVYCITLHVVYDVSSRKSFQALPHWLEHIENHGAVKLLVGNKLEKVNVLLSTSGPPKLPKQSPSSSHPPFSREIAHPPC